MSDFNGIGRPMLSAGIGRLYGVADPHVDSISSEISVTTSPWERPEFWALLGGSLGWGYVALGAGGAGVWNAVELRNPIGSGVLLICEQLFVANDDGANRQYRFGLRNDELSTSTGAWLNRDTRRSTTTGGSGSLAGRIRTQSPVGESTWNATFGRIGLASGDSKWIQVDYVMSPGTGLMVQNVAAQQGLIAGFIGRERPSPTTELQNL